MAVLYCGCTDGVGGNRQGVAYQDAQFGKGHRVHNQTSKEKPETYRCTICLKERPKPGVAEALKRAEEAAKQKAEEGKSGKKLTKARA